MASHLTFFSGFFRLAVGSNSVCPGRAITCRVWPGLRPNCSRTLLGIRQQGTFFSGNRRSQRLDSMLQNCLIRKLSLKQLHTLPP